ncbi:hypothetical protein NLJ89_g8626 [Agrocybe chaxingu]|uniref:SRPBCC domain-containing protein n=1 Tax=Agrocybe chaxingu TaxID=84603 RepID=A0A9W8JUW4_9AGAR|nr:hypothetical protein NLJ89_g8626 [Agrocybe chaxingu]
MADNNTHLPPLGSDFVFTVSSSALIDAPREKVWSILLDFSSYKEWSTFARSFTITDASGNPLPDQTPAEGKYMAIKVNMPPKLGEPGWFGSGSAFVTISTLDPENYRAAWKTAGMPYFILHTERWQALSVDETTGKTKYENIEAFGGLAAYLVRLFVGTKLKVGFVAAAECLKKRAEEK